MFSLRLSVSCHGLGGGAQQDRRRPALAARLRERHPAMRVLFMSGYGVEILAKYGAEVRHDAFLTKPIAPEVLRDCVTRLLGTR